MPKPSAIVCQVCKAAKRPSEVIPAALVRPAIVEVIRREHPDFGTDGAICIPDLNRFRAQYIEAAVASDKGRLSVLEEQVVDSLREREVLSSNMNIEFDRRLTVGERLADAIADFGGSWRFISIFGAVLLGWVVLNTVVLLARPFDPYPFILLNLVLSCLAAIQAPVIMMSQNRQEARDRLRAEHDYRINLKAELEIRHLHDKLDHLLLQQWQRLLEIQEIQIEIMEEISGRSGRSRGAGP
jgi:uncharacterized membrane protein